MRRLVVASALLATLLAGSLGMTLTPATAADLTDAERAASALTFMRAAQKADGSIDSSVAETADFIIGTADAHFDPATLTACSGKTALEYLASASDRAATDAGKTGKAVLAVRAAHLDPAQFEGRDLVARLTALYRASTGAYGDGSTFSQSLAILGLHTAGAAVPPEAIAYLAGLQDTDGSWNYQAKANSTDGDTNSTAIALIALSAAGNHAGDAKALAFLHTQQLSDGGFPYQNSTAFGTPASDPDSDSLVLQALIVTGESPTAAAWTKGASNLLSHLRSTQAAGGGFTFPGNPRPDAFTTSQAVIGLTGNAYGSATEFSAGANVPRAACPAGPTPPPTATAPVPAPSPDGTPFLPIVLAGLGGLVTFRLRRRSQAGA